VVNVQVVLFVLGPSAASLFRELSPGLVTWRRRAALAGLVIQGVLGFFMAVVYSFSFSLGVGFWLVLLIWRVRLQLVTYATDSPGPCDELDRTIGGNRECGTNALSQVTPLLL
jgi:hypothetical protein